MARVAALHLHDLLAVQTLHHRLAGSEVHDSAERRQRLCRQEHRHALCLVRVHLEVAILLAARLHTHRHLGEHLLLLGVAELVGGPVLRVDGHVLLVIAEHLLRAVNDRLDCLHAADGVRRPAVQQRLSGLDLLEVEVLAISVRAALLVHIAQAPCPERHVLREVTL